VLGYLAKVSLPDFKGENIRPKTFTLLLTCYAQNSATHRFMSLNNFSISEPRDAKFFVHVFPLKRKDSTTPYGTIPVDDNVPLSASSSGVRILVDEPRRSKRPRVETSFDPDLLTYFLIEDFDVNFLSNETVSAFFIEEDPKSYEEAMRSIDVSF